MKNKINKIISTLTIVLGLSQTSQAQQTSLWGSGYWGGQQGCSVQQSQGNQSGFPGLASQESESESGRGQVSKSKKTEKQNQSKKYEAEKTILEKKQERLTKKIEKFFDSEISDFLLQTHFEKMNRCDDYRTYPQHQCDSGENKAICDGKDEVPQKLKDKWTTSSGGGYCAANSNSSRGNIQSAICADNSLRPTDGSRYRSNSTSECTQAISEYRKNKIKIDQLQEKIERTEDEISELEYASEEEKLNPKTDRSDHLSQTEGGCEQCDLAGRTGNVQKSNRDWWSTAANFAGGLGMIWYGKKIDESAQSYNAQLGFPSINSYGAPIVASGFSTLINGLTGANGNCESSIASNYGIGSYNRYSNNGLSNGGYFNGNSYTAFGYPQSYGSSIYGNSYYGGSGATGSIYGGLYGNYGSNYNSYYGTNYSGTGYSGVTQLQQQLQAYSQIPTSQQTPDIQLMVAQLQARIAAMSSASYSYTSNYGLNSLYNNYGSTSYYPYSTTTNYGVGGR